MFTSRKLEFIRIEVSKFSPYSMLLGPKGKIKATNVCVNPVSFTEFLAQDLGCYHGGSVL